MRRAWARRAPPLLADDRLDFPDPARSPAQHPLARGGDLSPERLVHAYERGIFPWYGEGTPPLWWSPDPRAILEPHAIHVSRSLRRTLRQRRFRVGWSERFDEVVAACATVRRRGTWILPEMARAYSRLHELGHAHSVEVWEETELVGGMYGVLVGGLFAGESMFSRATDASKVALVVGARALFTAGLRLFDVQFRTDHLASLGVTELPRAEYLQRARDAVGLRVALGKLDLEAACQV